jgi:dTDP-4-dehydrorhamnose 3,5-epimerase
MIDGVEVKELTNQLDERGHVTELFRADDVGDVRFGQVHLATVRPGVVKGWHRHVHRTDLLTCVRGIVRLGLYDPREASPTHLEVNEMFLGPERPLRVKIPPKVWFGLKGVGPEEAYVVVLTDEPHNRHVPDEERWDPEVNEIPFDWERRDR